MKALYMIPVVGGNPVLPEDTSINTALHAIHNGFGLYTISATAGDLNTLTLQDGVCELLRRGIPEEGEEPPPPFDQMPIPGTMRIRFNAWAADNMPEAPVIKGGDTGAVFVEVVRTMGGADAEFTFTRTDVMEREV